MLITIPYEITSQRLADMMVTAIEGNDMTRSWCKGIYLKSSNAGISEDGTGTDGGIWYAEPKLFDFPFTIDVHEIEDEHSGKIKVHTINRASFEAGLVKMATHEDTRSHFNDMITENDDAVTGDVFLQLITLGALVYG